MYQDTENLDVLGYGYAMPYLRYFMTKNCRVFALAMPDHIVSPWPHQNKEKNLTCVSLEQALPLENSSIDLALIIHGFEFSPHPGDMLEELWRVMKPEGKVVIIVPNRSGLWSHAEWTPLGHGMPYSVLQLSRYLEDHNFFHERTEEALFMPPLRYAPILRSALFFESIGRFMLPVAAGVHIIEARKRMFSGTPVTDEVPDHIEKRSFSTKTVPQG